MVFLFDFLEHLEKEEALNLLARIITNNKSVLLSTPEGFTKQNKEHGNIYQIHKCGFNVKDFKPFNLKVVLINKLIFAYSSHLKTKATIKNQAKRKIPKSIRKRLLHIINPQKYKILYESD